MRDRQLGTTVLASATPSGTPGNGTTIGSMLSGDGSFIVFASSGTDLVTGDTNGAYDIFERASDGESPAILISRDRPAGRPAGRAPLSDDSPRTDVIRGGGGTRATRPPLHRINVACPPPRSSWRSRRLMMRMNKMLAGMLALVMGYGAVLNGGNATITPPRGATVDGFAGPISASKKRSHEVVYADGRTCVVESSVSAGYVLADVVFWFLLGVLVDAATGGWKTLDDDACPGVMVD